MPIPAIAAGIMAGGALLGGAGSVTSSNQAANNIRRSRAEIDALKAKFPDQANVIEQQLKESYSPYISTAGDDYQSYRDAVGGTDYDAMRYQQADPFGYNLQAGIKEFMDPSMALQIREATGAVEGSAANRGKLFSSATGKAIADRSQEIAQKSWKDALQAAMQDRGFQYQQYSGDIDRTRQVSDQDMRIAQQRIGDLGALAGMGQQASLRYGDLMTQNKQNLFQSQNQADLTKAQMGMQTPATGFGAFLQGAGQSLGTMAPFLSTFGTTGGR